MRLPTIVVSILLLSTPVLLLVSSVDLDLGNPSGARRYDALGQDSTSDIRRNEPTLEMDGCFIENRGQMGQGAGRFYATGYEMSVALHDDCIAYQIHPSNSVGGPGGSLYKVRFLGAEPTQPIGTKTKDFRSHFFMGNEKEDHITDVRSYEEVLYPGLYPFIDLRFYFMEGRLKYDIKVRPGGDPGDVLLGYEGAQRLELEGGDLLVHTPADTVRELAPVAYQDSKEDLVQVPVRYTIQEGSHVGFEVGKFDPSTTLVIDPEVSFSTFIGSTQWDEGDCIHVDKNGHIFLAGLTKSPGFPNTTGAFDSTHNGHGDVFVAKIGPKADKVIWSTFIGTSDWDSPSCMHVDDKGCVYLAGITGNSSFPTTEGAFCRTVGGLDDSFYLKLDQNGSKLLFSTLYGGEGRDLPFAMEIDSKGCAYLTGRARSKDFPTTTNALDTTLGGMGDTYILKFNSNASKVLYSTFIGGGDFDNGWGLELVGTDLYVAGGTYGQGFPITAGAYDTTFNGKEDCFLLRFNIENLTLDYSTYFGGSSWDRAWGLAVDSQGFAFVTGITESDDFPVTKGAFDTKHNGDSDGFVLKIDLRNSSLAYSTYIGGNLRDTVTQVVLDNSGNAFLKAATESTDFPVTPEAMDGRHALDDSFDGALLKLNHNGSKLIYSTFLGGVGYDGISEIMVVNSTYIYLTGLTGSWDFPLTNGTYQTVYAGEWDAFIMKIWFDPPYIGQDITPRYATTGDPFTFNVTMLAPLKVKTALVEYWYGRSGDHTYIPLRMSSGNSTNGTWTATITVPLHSLSPLRYRFHLHDSIDDYRYSGTERVIVIDNDLPELVDECVPPATTGDPFNFSVNLTDNIGIAGARVVFWLGNDTEHPWNISLVGRDLYGLGNGTYSNMTFKLPASSLAPLHYYLLCNDTSGNWNRTENRTINVLDDDAPIIADHSPNRGTTGDAYVFNATVIDNIGVSRVYVVYWCLSPAVDGANVSMSAMNITGQGNGSYEYPFLELPLYSTRPLHYFLIAEDLSGNWNRTEVRTVEVVDDDLPELFDDHTPSGATTGDPLVFRVSVRDNIGVEPFYVWYWFGNASTDFSSQLMEGEDLDERGNGTYTGVITVPNSSLAPISYIFLLYDGVMHNRTPTRTVVVYDNDVPELTGMAIDEEVPCGSVAHFLVNVSDNIGVSSVRLEYSLGMDGEHGSMDMVGHDLSGHGNGTYVAEVEVPLDFLGTLSFTIIAVDSSENRAFTNGTVRVVDLTPPSVQPLSTPESGLKGLEVTFQVDAIDNIGVEHVWFCRGHGQEDENPLQMNRTRGDTFEIVFRTSRQPLDGITVLYYYFVAFDTSGNRDVTRGWTLTLVNSPPSIKEIPTWTVQEGTRSELDLGPYIEDMNDPLARMRLRCSDTNVTVEGTVLSVLFEDWVPEMTVEVEVSDGEDTTWANITIVVINTNDPPSAPEILQPLNGSEVREGENVTFEVRVSDPDMKVGEVLTVEWSSSISGHMRRMTSKDELLFTTDELTPGVHRINVTVDDGEYSASSWVELTVLEKTKPPSTPEDDWLFNLPDDTLWIIIAIIIITTAGVVLRMWYQRRS